MIDPKLKLMFMGTPDVAAQVLQSLSESGFKFKTVVTRPDKPQGRSQAPTAPPVKTTALELGIPCFQPQNKAELEQIVAEHQPDLILVVAFGMIIPQTVLDTPKFGALNVHYSLLPKYRGAAPVVAAILNGDQEAGTTIMRISAGLDEGDIIDQEKIALNGKETAPELLDTLTEISIKLLEEIIPDWVAGKLAAREQQGEPSYFKTIQKEAGQINWSTMTAVQIERMSRALVPWPGTYTFWNDHKIELFDLGITENPDLKPGQVKVAESQILISTASGAVTVGALKLEGKTRVSAADFIRGHQDFNSSNLT